VCVWAVCRVFELRFFVLVFSEFCVLRSFLTVEFVAATFMRHGRKQLHHRGAKGEYADVVVLCVYVLCGFKVEYPFVDFQLDVKNSYLFIYNTFIKFLCMFRALPCSSPGGLRRNCIYMQLLVSSL
jgi:hypothetical protein